MREEFHDVEEIARMLAVHRGDQFAAVDVFERERRKIEVDHECVAGGHGRGRR